MNEFERCIKERHLIAIKTTKEMIHKEMESAAYDLNRSKDSLSAKDYKWTAVQAYYSMFHAAKALVLKKGYREKSHFCLIIALTELYQKQGTIPRETVDNLEMCLRLRHNADYGLVYDKENAETAVQYAQQFLSQAKKLV